MACVFCGVEEDRVLACNKHAIALPDEYPVANGHCLVVPRRHIERWVLLEDEEISALWDLVEDMQLKLTATLKPDGFTIGINDGEAAGQLESHAHIHIIPRYKGDVPDPRGGVRWVIPDKAKYWE